MCIKSNLSTIDPWLSRPQVSGHLNYPDWVMTVQLECFESVCFIRIFDRSNYLNTQGPISLNN